MKKINSKTSIKFISYSNGRKTKIQLLDTDCFSNNEKIIEAKTESEWKDAAKNHIPAWHNSNISSNGSNFKLYNWYAISDSKGICSNNFQIPNIDTLNFLKNEVSSYFKKKPNIFRRGTNMFFDKRYLFDFFPTNYIESNGKHTNNEHSAIIWTQIEYDKNNAYCYVYDFIEKKIRYLPYSKDYGFAVLEIEK
jgi:uncharacterized protein (TIGR02145 family)